MIDAALESWRYSCKAGFQLLHGHMHDIIVNDGANSATTILAARPRIYDMPTICEHRDATRSGSVCSRLAMLCTPLRSDCAQHTMLLIGIKISFTKKPMKPMIAKPIVVACAIFENSATRARQAE